MKTQTAAKISPELLNRLIAREFPNDKKLVTSKLELVKSDSDAGKRRISAAILKLANRNIHELDILIEKANFDFRDIISEAEYSRYSQVGFDEQTPKELKSKYLANDLATYKEWLHRTD